MTNPWEPMINETAPERASPQALAYESNADILLFGGAAGGGKTDLLLGLALTRHHRSIIFRRAYTQLRSIEERVKNLLGGDAGYRAQAKTWALPDGRTLEFGACQHAGDERAYQGRPHDLKAFDEITHFLEPQFRFLSGWLRTTEAGQRCRIVCAGNPPTDTDGEWVTRFWSPWLDAAHENPAKPGELRWFAVIDGEDREVEGAQPFVWQGEAITPQSRTFIPSRIEDNPYLLRTGYKAQLQSLPEPLRAQMLKGAFDARPMDDPWAVIPSAWLRAAQARWQPNGASGPMTAVGVDPARGGVDETVLSPRFGAWFGAQITAPGVETPDGPSVAALIVKVLRGGAPVALDVIGIGASVFDHLKANGINVQAMNGASGSDARDRSGALGFTNARAEWWWRMREALDPDYGEGLALPPDPRLLADLAAPRWKLAARGVQIEPKAEITKRLGRSPDRGEAAVYALNARPLMPPRAEHQPETHYDVMGY